MKKMINVIMVVVMSMILINLPVVKVEASGCYYSGSVYDAVCNSDIWMTNYVDVQTNDYVTTSTTFNWHSIYYLGHSLNVKGRVEESYGSSVYVGRQYNNHVNGGTTTYYWDGSYNEFDFYGEAFKSNFYFKVDNGEAEQVISSMLQYVD